LFEVIIHLVYLELGQTKGPVFGFEIEGDIRGHALLTRERGGLKVEIKLIAVLL
jgi:hypothetical protein